VYQFQEVSPNAGVSGTSYYQGVKQNLPLAIEMYEQVLAARHDNRYDWNLDPENYNHFPWLESRLKQAKYKLAAL